MTSWILLPEGKTMKCPCCQEQFELISIAKPRSYAHYCETAVCWFFGRGNLITNRPFPPPRGELSAQARAEEAGHPSGLPEGA